MNKSVFDEAVARPHRDETLDVDAALAAARARSAPLVSRLGNRWVVPLGMVGIAAIGVFTFSALRKPVVDSGTLPPSINAVPSSSAELPLLASLAPVPIAVPAPPAEPPPEPVLDSEPPTPPPHVSTPVLVVDLSVGDTAVTPPAAALKAASDKLSVNEAFADRLARSSPETAGIDRLSSIARVVPQGTIIPAVLETAINSDLPGLVRALVSRDVKGFDGTEVLIPRGSRLIGQYSSGVALGQSRAFVIWTRVLRPDGVSVQLASAATDQLGQAGLSGKVDTHFLRRFGAATLLSVLTGAIDYVVSSAGNGQVLVGGPAQANQLASIALQRQIDIQPTIKVPQGTPLRVFVARDLDFDLSQTK